MKTVVTIEGETWVAHLTPEEYAEWRKYADTHEWLFGGISQQILSKGKATDAAQ